MSAPLRTVLDSLFDLVEHGPGEGAEPRLVVLLDELAWRTHASRLHFDDAALSDARPPRPDYAELRRKVAERFPAFGPYAAVSSLDDDPELVTMDAVDDLADLLRDLEDVRWYWDHTSVDEALWHLDFSRRSHWEHHLRQLQVDLCRRLNRGAGARRAPP